MVLHYLAVYLVMNLGAFLVVAAIGRTIGSDELRDYAGLAHRMPFAAMVLAVTLLALAGIPPMGSYVGKAMLFAAAIGAGFAWLAVVAALNTAVSIVYYLRVLDAAYLRSAPDLLPVDERRKVPAATLLAVAIAGAATILLGILPQPLLAVAVRASLILAGT